MIAVSDQENEQETKSPSPDSIEDLPMDAMLGTCVRCNVRYLCASDATFQQTVYSNLLFKVYMYIFIFYRNF